MNHQPEQPSHERSHRRIGEQLDLFHFPAHSPGAACWHSRGLLLYNALSCYISELSERYGYQEVRSPLVCSESLWERSGHAEKFREKMFCFEVDGQSAGLKPMNCPGHAELYLCRPRSYRELPLRIAEQGHVHRLEQSGEINGLLRARSFVIDDGHIFCSEDQVPAELRGCLQMAAEVYSLLGLELHCELSLRPELRLGSDEQWERAEQALRDALDDAGLRFEECPGEGAFYGPKADLHISDSLGRSWQMGSVQLDFQLPERFDLRYVSADGCDRDERGRPYRPVIVHRALLGSFERFIGILIEHFDGRFPLWLAPEAVRILPISAPLRAQAERFRSQLRAAGVRARVVDDGPLSGRIRDAEQWRVPVLAVIGQREADQDSVMIRRLGEQHLLSVQSAVDELRNEVADRRLAVSLR